MENFNIEDIKIEKIDYSLSYNTRNYLQYSRVIRETSVGKSAFGQISNDPRVVALDGLHLSFGSRSEMFSAEKLAMWFLWRAREVGQERARVDLDQFLESENIDVIISSWVLGISTENIISLHDGIEICPIDKMPDNDEKETFLQGPSRGYAGHSMPMPKAALIRRVSVPKTIGSTAPPDSRTLKEFWHFGDEIRDTALIINLISGTSCIRYFETSYTPNDIPLGPFGGGGGSGPVHDIVSYHWNSLGQEAAQEISELFNAFKNLSAAERKRFKLAISRFSQAKRRLNLEEKILDLCISLEMILLRDLNDKSLLSLKFCLRGSWLLGKNFEERKQIFDTLKKLYNYRSQVAHSGTLKQDDAMEAGAFWPQFEQIGENTIKRLLIGRSPNWSELILGQNDETVQSSSCIQ